ncbi:hypothetical protein [Streptomyces microflavus]
MGTEERETRLTRSEVVRYHSEEAASYSAAADNAVTDQGRSLLREAAAEHQALADMARHYEYPEDLDDPVEADRA